jgi:tight adherence protein B
MSVTAGALVVAGGVLATGSAARAAAKAARRGRVRHRLPAPPRPAVRLPKLPAPAWLPGAIDAAVIGVDPGAAWTIAVTTVTGAALAGGVIGGLALAVLGGGTTAGGLALTLVTRRDRAAIVMEQALPGTLDAVARSLRTGASLRAAVREAASTVDGHLQTELQRVTTDVERGVPLVVALDALATRRPLPGVRLAVAALALGVETGGAQSRAIDGVAATLRDRLAAHAEARALSAQARASVWVIALSPVGFCAFAIATDPRTASFYFRSSYGLAFLASGIALDALGAMWMRRFTRVTP